VKVTQDFYKYKEMLYGKTLATHELDLPPLKYHTRGLWFTIPGIVADALENIFPKKDSYAGSLHGAEHALISMFPLLVLCDRFDIGGLSTNYHPQTRKATIFIYDAYEGELDWQKRQWRSWINWWRSPGTWLKAASAVRDAPPASTPLNVVMITSLSIKGGPYSF
jgi:ATP-dependent helicase YprA (DUF1998 family)